MKVFWNYSLVTIFAVARVEGQCHAEGDREYCLKGWTTTSTPDCHMIGSEMVCFGVTGPTSTLYTVSTTTRSTSATPTSELERDHDDEASEPAAQHKSVHPQPTDSHSNRSQKKHDDKEEEMEEKAHAEPAMSGHGHGQGAKGSAQKCMTKENEEYSLKLRVGAIFIILTTSSIGVLCPIVVRRYARPGSQGLLFVFFKQFGTGIIVSTVFIHLLSHAVMQFENPCVGELGYEGTAMAIAMAGVFLSFLVDFLGVQHLRRVRGRRGSCLLDTTDPMPHVTHEKNTVSMSQVTHVEHAQTDTTRERIEEEKLSVMIMEGGIIFHSILVGVLLAVTPDHELAVLFAVVLVHQMFEGVALGARIEPLEGITYTRKILMALAFSFTAPVGMAIGVGVRKSFNGSDRNTALTLGTMDALSAGVLAWVAFVELWSKDWLHGEMRDADLKKTSVGMLSLILGLGIMSLLGKWA